MLKTNSFMRAAARAVLAMTLFATAAAGKPDIVGHDALKSPRIHHPIVTGCQVGHPFIWRVPTTGERPMDFRAENLPEGLKINGGGIITGQIDKPGVYTVTVAAENEHGRHSRRVLLVCGRHMLALTPPMGWNSWNVWARSVTAEKVKAAAKAMVETGLADYGWRYVNIDDCWMRKPGHDDPKRAGRPRDKKGMILANDYFPDMPALTEYIHGFGLKAGLYTSPGPTTCQGYEAAHLHEYRDAQRFAEWGFDYLKYDWCGYRHIVEVENTEDLMRPYRIMRHALDHIDRDIVYSICEYGMGEPWKWSNHPSIRGNSWRTTGDIRDSWRSMKDIGFRHSRYAEYAGPGHWNDADMLVIGKVGWGPNLHQTKLTHHEQITHISLWCMIGSPLLLGNDLTRMEPFTLKLLTNPEVLAVSQDPLGRVATRVRREGQAEIWSRPLWDGCHAVGLFNRGEKPLKIRVNWDDLRPKPADDKPDVRDLWRRRRLGSFEGGYETTVMPHGAALLKVGSPKQEDAAIKQLVRLYEKLIEQRRR